MGGTILRQHFSARWLRRITSDIAVILRGKRHDVGRPLEDLLVGRLRDRIRRGDEKSQDQG